MQQAAGAGEEPVNVFRFFHKNRILFPASRNYGCLNGRGGEAIYAREEVTNGFNRDRSP
jgi:hypothetical protein